MKIYICYEKFSKAIFITSNNFKILMKLSNKIVAPVNIWKRVFAFFIDYALINFIIVLPFKDFFINLETYSFTELKGEFFIVSCLIIILTLLYWIVFDYFLKQTPGKAIFNINIRSKQKDLKLWQCVVRNLTKISIVLLILDSLKILYKQDYQRFFEKLSKTEVVDGEI